jgi:uncharacterized protein
LKKMAEHIEILFFVTALLAEIIGTIAGFGTSTIFMPVSLFFLASFQTAIVLVAFLHLFGNVGKLIFFRQGLLSGKFDKKTLLYFGLPSVIFTIIGALLVSIVAQDVLKLLLGLFLMFFTTILFMKPNFSLKPSAKNSLIGGGFSGLSAGLIGTGGALRASFFNSFRLKKEVYIPTVAAISLAVDVFRIPIYVASGFLTPGFYWYLPVLFVIAIVGTFTGKKIVDRIPQETFSKIVLGALFFAGLKFAYDGIINLS